MSFPSQKSGLRADAFIVKNFKSFLPKAPSSCLPENSINEMADLSRSFWQKNIVLGFIKLKQKKIKPSSRISELDENSLIFNWKNILKSWEIFHQKKAIGYPGKIYPVFEDKNFIVINKPVPLSVHSAFPLNYKLRREVSLIDQIHYRYPEIVKNFQQKSERSGIVHRLDRETSGLLIIAKNEKTESYFKNIFKKRLIEKKYLALVEGELPDKNFIIEGWIGKSKKSPLKRAFCSFDDDKYLEKIINPKKSLTEGRVIFSGSLSKFQKGKYLGKKICQSWINLMSEILESKKTYSLLDLNLKTGRTHQIRVHLASIGFPIVGDSLYGKKEEVKIVGQALHSHEISFFDPTGKRVSFGVDELFFS